MDIDGEEEDRERVVAALKDLTGPTEGASGNVIDSKALEARKRSSEAVACSVQYLDTSLYKQACSTNGSPLPVPKAGHTVVTHIFKAT